MNYRRVYLPLVICLAVGWLFSAAAQTKRPMTVEDVIALNRASDVQLALDGRRVAFVVTAWDQEADRFNADIWTALADIGGAAMRLTFNARRDDHPRWAPDGQRLAFLSERGEKEGAQIYLINPQGGEAQPLTNHAAAIQAFEWSPDSRYVAFIAEVPKPAAKPKTKPPIVVDDDPRYAQLWVLEVETRQVKQMTKGTRHVAEFGWSFDTTQIVFTARQSPKLENTDTTEVFVLPFRFDNETLDSAAARQLTHGNGAEVQPRFSPDGRWISWLAHADGPSNVGPERIHLFPANAVGEGLATRVLARTFNGYIRNYRWLYNSAQLIVQADVGVHSRLYNLDLSGRAPQVMTPGEGVCGSSAASPDGLQVVYTFEHPRMGSEVAGLNARTLLPMQLTQLNPQTADFFYGQTETIKWKSNDGTVIEGLFFYPSGYESDRRYPLVTYIHGGPEGAYTRGFNASWGAAVQVLTGKGYAVFLPNFRGSSNYGAAFAQANSLKAGQVDAEDVLSGIDELVKRGLADETKLAIAGWSYGGYLSGWLIGHTDRFKCAVYGAGLSNAVSYWGTADITYQRERLHGGTPWEARKLYDQQSPLTFLPNAKTPTLIFHGEKDDRVPLGQSQESYRTLKRMDVPVQLVIYPEQGHSLALPSYQLDKLKREIEWLDRHLGNKQP
ncbi:MAG: S9 family peptidase [Acidobacteria bacterium]|nr:S9 family peptidase [Acidobacteriota bacterium]MBI3427680.1 S9 family peptidase [Acidobacteriota bacterium]